MTRPGDASVALQLLFIQSRQHLNLFPIKEVDIALNSLKQTEQYHAVHFCTNVLHTFCWSFLMNLIIFDYLVLTFDLAWIS